MNKTDTILLSIHPQHVENILRGTKRFELRRRVPSHIKHVVIYATAPQCRIVAIAEIEKILGNTPSALWEKVRGASGVSSDLFFNYFRGCNIAYALQIGRVKKLGRKISLSHSRLKLTPPQSFTYFSEKKFNWLSDSVEAMLSGGSRKFFLGGVHGSGKSTLSERVISSFGFHCVSASSLIREGRMELSLDKTVSDVQENQKVLLAGLEKIQKNYTHLLIDGHFCLLKEDGAIEDIPINVFEDINPEILILAHPSVEVLEERLKKRPDPINPKVSIPEFLQRELAHAQKVAHRLSIKLHIIDTGENEDNLHAKIASILAESRNITDAE
jgi:predicted transcriptional regulator/adenylate kinase